MPLSRDNVPLSEQLLSEESTAPRRNATRTALFHDAGQPEEYIDFDVPGTEVNADPRGSTEAEVHSKDPEHNDDVENRRKALLRSLMAKRANETVYMTRDAVNVIAGVLSTPRDAPLLYKQQKYSVVSTHDYFDHLKKKQTGLFDKVTG